MLTPDLVKISLIYYVYINVEKWYASWKTWKITDSFPSPGNVIEFDKIRKCPGKLDFLVCWNHV